MRVIQQPSIENAFLEAFAYNGPNEATRSHMHTHCRHMGILWRVTNTNVCYGSHVGSLAGYR